jgi:hypothetical protein
MEPTPHAVTSPAVPASSPYERTTPSARYRLDPDGIVWQTITKQSEQTVEDARLNIQVFQELRGERRVGVLVDMRGDARTSKAALDVYASEAATRGCVGSALLTDSALSVIVGNLFIAMSRPRIPTRLFSNEAKALKWLRDLLNPS